jgi:hypothetical protein
LLASFGGVVDVSVLVLDDVEPSLPVVFVDEVEVSAVPPPGVFVVVDDLSVLVAFPLSQPIVVHKPSDATITNASKRFMSGPS